MEGSHSKSPGSLHHEDSWICHRCGWTYPNPHPSAKHRRNHKKHCGKIKGFELVGGTHNGGSSDEASSNEEGHAKKEHFSKQSQQLLHPQSESLSPAAVNNPLAGAEAAGTVDDPTLSPGSQNHADYLATDLSKEVSPSLERISAGTVDNPALSGDGQNLAGGSANDQSREISPSQEGFFINTEGSMLQGIATSPPLTQHKDYFTPSSDSLDEQKEGSSGVKEESHPVAIEEVGTPQRQDLHTTNQQDSSISKEEACTNEDGVSTAAYGEEEGLSYPTDLEKDTVSTDFLQLDTGKQGDEQIPTQDSLMSKREASVNEQSATPGVLNIYQQDIWICHHCGWTYPNAHPSAKHRRNHKKHCNNMRVSKVDGAAPGGSSEEASSDEENHDHKRHHEEIQGDFPVAPDVGISSPKDMQVEETTSKATPMSEETKTPLGDEYSKGTPTSEEYGLSPAVSDIGISSLKDMHVSVVEETYSEATPMNEETNSKATPAGNTAGVVPLDTSTESELSKDVSNDGKLQVEENNETCPSSESRDVDPESPAEILENGDGGLSTSSVVGHDIASNKASRNTSPVLNLMSENVNAENGSMQDDLLLNPPLSNSDGVGFTNEGDTEVRSDKNYITEKIVGPISEQSFLSGEMKESGTLMGQPENLMSNLDHGGVSTDLSVPLLTEGQEPPDKFPPPLEERGKSNEGNVTPDLTMQTSGEKSSEEAMEKVSVNSEEVLHEGVVPVAVLTNDTKALVEDTKQDDPAKCIAAVDIESYPKDSEAGKQLQEEDSSHEAGKQLQEEDSCETMHKGELLPRTVYNRREPETVVESAAVRAAPPGRTDSIETETYEDAPDSFETGSVGGSIDENDIMDDSNQIEDGKLEGKNLDVESKEQLKLQNMLDHSGISGLGCEDKDTPLSKLKYSGKSTTQDLKAPSPEAWQEIGTSEVGSEDNEVQTEEVVHAAVPKSSDTEVKEHQITEKTHTPLRSLLAKEGTEKADQNHNIASTVGHGEVETVEGTWNSHSVTKTKTRSIWSHCICCPAVH